MIFWMILSGLGFLLFYWFLCRLMDEAAKDQKDYEVWCPTKKGDR